MKLILTLFAIAFGAKADNDATYEAILNNGNNQFTAQMFHQVVKAKPGKSVVLSAFCVLTPLAQLGLASVGDSQVEIFRSIGFHNATTTKATISLLNNKLRSVKGVELKMANRVYIPKGYEISEQFAALSKDSIPAEIKNVDFTKNMEAAKAINEWVEDQTNHRIKDLISPDSLGADTRALLVNAIYFKGTWDKKFNKEETTSRDFHVTKEKTIKVPTMHRKGNYKYAESEELDAKLLEIPYVGYESSFLVVLPNKIDGLAALEEKLKDPSALEKATAQMFEFEVDVYLPKFKIETTTNLKEVLKKMNVKRMFSSEEAKLDNLLKNAKDLYVSEAVQKAFIEVNEEGAEAAAANVFGMVGSRPLPKPPTIIFNVNRPFYFAIKVGSLTIFNGVTKK